MSMELCPKCMARAKDMTSCKYCNGDGIVIKVIYRPDDETAKWAKENLSGEAIRKSIKEYEAIRRRCNVRNRAAIIAAAWRRRLFINKQH